MKDRNRKLSIIHVAKKQLALSDENYRALLFGAAGIDSAAKIKTEQQYKAVMEALREAGFKSRSGKKAMTDRQLAKCYAMWCELYDKGEVRNKEYSSMMKWIAGRTGGTNIRFLRREQKSLMIEELKAWLERVEGKDDRNG